MTQLETRSDGLPVPGTAADVTHAVQQSLQFAVEMQASDLHFRPTSAGLELAWRRDGVHAVIGYWSSELAANVVGRLKVLADLLTYRTDVPQEGRLRDVGRGLEMRLSTFPTLHGEKAVVRILAGTGRYELLADLGLSPAVLNDLRRQLEETTGCLIFAGPAGSGKTTTAYACLREILRSQSGKALVTLEDPIEAELSGVSQSQVHRPAEFTYGLGLRSLMRQDPDVILVGEIRDRETAETAFQASLTGHLILSTLHAGSAAQGVTRLRDLGVEPYLLRAGLRGVLCQRLLRRTCPECTPNGTAAECRACFRTGYRGRLLIAEFLSLAQCPESLADLERISALELQQRAMVSGMVELAATARNLCEQELTTEAELLRVLGTDALRSRTDVTPAHRETT